jgi:DNA-binding NtrC family response regulator
MEHAVVLSRTDKITARDLPVQVRQPSTSGAAPSTETVLPHRNLTVEDAEKELNIRALKETNGNRTLAASKIGISRRSLHRKLHSYHLEGF